LVAAPSWTDRAQREQAKKKVEDLLKRIRNGEDFADIAKSNSDGPTAKLGGDLRFFSHGKSAPSLERIVFGMKVGDVCDVVPTKQGFVILKVLDKRIGMAPGALANTPPAESGVQILSDTLGFDFYPYLNQSVVPAVTRKWYKVIPKEGLPPTRKKGRVVVESV